jgi:hypothetical protein
MTSLKRIRWAVRAALFLGVAASIAGNVLHAQDSFVSQVISAWSPIALLITIELISRIPVHRRGLALARWAATALIAGIAAWVSYWHMAAVASRYGETGASPYLLPLSVDGLVVVASICLVELAGRIREAEQMPVSAPAVTAPMFQYDRPIGPMRAPVGRPKVDRPRKPPPTAEAKVVKAHERWPGATHAELAKRANVSLSTVKTYRPKPERINGREPELVGAGANEKES